MTGQKQIIGSKNEGASDKYLFSRGPDNTGTNGIKTKTKIRFNSWERKDFTDGVRRKLDKNRTMIGY